MSAATLEARDVEVRLSLGSLHFELGSLEQADLAFHMAGEIDPADSHTLAKDNLGALDLFSASAALLQ